MRVKLQLVMCSDDGQAETVTAIVTWQKDCQRIAHQGLTLAEAKLLLHTIQQRLLQRQVDALLDSCSTCPDCGTPLKVQGYHTRNFRTLFGTFTLASLRLLHDRWRRRKTTSFRPLTALLTESVASAMLKECGFRDDPFVMQQEIGKQLEHFEPQGNQLPGTPEFLALEIESTLRKNVAHTTPLLQWRVLSHKHQENTTKLSCYQCGRALYLLVRRRSRHPMPSGRRISEI